MDRGDLPIGQPYAGASRGQLFMCLHQMLLSVPDVEVRFFLKPREPASQGNKLFHLMEPSWNANFAH